MSHLLLDSGPVILQLRNHKRTIQLLRGLGSSTKLAISAITRVEVRAYMQPHEQFMTQKLLARFFTYNVDREIADKTGDIIAALRRQGKSIAIPDALIASTAIINRLTLLTFNLAHFVIVPGLSLYPLPDDAANW